MRPTHPAFCSRTVAGLAALCAALACGGSEPRGSGVAVAELEPTQGNQARGEVRFETLPDGGLRVVADVRGLPAGPHGMHVHVEGDCGEGGAAAGPHFNFLAPAEQGEGASSPDRITGNLGELQADASGRVRLEGVVKLAQLEGPRSIAGRAVVVHAEGNDPSAPPDGNAGARIACGVIEPAESSEIAARSDD